MFRISHNNAIELEYLVGRLYRCERSGVSGMVDADYFEGHPIQAAVLVVAYIYANGLELDSLRYDEFLTRYENIFEYPEENDMDIEVRNYLRELTEIVDQYSL